MEWLDPVNGASGYFLFTTRTPRADSADSESPTPAVPHSVATLASSHGGAVGRGVAALQSRGITLTAQ